MSNEHNHRIEQAVDGQHNSDRQFIYQIRIEGHLDQQWARWFEEMTISLEENGETLISGVVIDQAALHSLLRKIRDIGAPLISVLRLDDAQTDIEL